MAERLTHAVATIPSGTALSQEIDLAGHQLVGIHMPSAWTAASLTFKAKPKSSTASTGVATSLQDVYNEGGTEVSVTTAASRYVAVTGATLDALIGCERIQVRSGTTGAAVNQGADRQLVLILAVRGS